MRIFLCGDVMTGRGIDQALPHPCSPIPFTKAVFSRLSTISALPNGQTAPCRGPWISRTFGARLSTNGAGRIRMRKSLISKRASPAATLSSQERGQMDDWLSNGGTRAVRASIVGKQEFAGYWEYS